MRSFPFTIKVTDSLNGSATKSLTLKVYPQLSISGTTLPPGEKTVAYKQTIQASGGDRKYSWSIFSGDTPPGLSLVGNTLKGTPSEAGTYSFTIQVCDDIGSYIQYLSLSINDIPSITTSDFLTPGTVNTIYTPYQLLALGGSGIYKAWSIVASQGYSLPPGLKLDSKTGIISGKPSKSGAYTFRVKVIDSMGGSNTKDLSIVINAG